jgi:hypothetical protein
MIQIGDKIISREIFENQFICKLSACFGNCCVFGDSGAPLESEEAERLTANMDILLPYLRPEAKRAIDRQGAWLVDIDGDKVTPLIGQEECAYVVFEDKVARCTIEKAFEEGAVSFRKPISCHLYPIRVTKLGKGIALNYHRWGICEPARVLGAKKELPVFRFLKDPLTRAFGEVFYAELELVFSEMNKNDGF